MFFVFPTTILCALLHSIPILADSFSPSFYPYCSRSHSCRGACSCSTSNCTLLPMDDTTREEILLHHNKIRNSQTENLPQPSGLALLEYDLELEDVSSCWASRCEDEVSECFKTPNFPEISQSVGQLILEEDDIPDTELWMRLMDTWLVLLEELPLGMLYINNDTRDLSEHNLAQILSDKILFVGCAWSISENWIFFVCSYGPKGPLAGDEIYKVGELCSTCPGGYKCFDVKPFDRLCNPTNRDQNITNNKPKFPRMRSCRAGGDTAPTKKKRRSDLPSIVGASVFFVLFLFFILLGVYSYVVSRISPNAIL